MKYGLAACCLLLLLLAHSREGSSSSAAAIDPKLVQGSSLATAAYGARVRYAQGELFVINAVVEDLKHPVIDRTLLYRDPESNSVTRVTVSRSVDGAVWVPWKIEDYVLIIGEVGGDSPNPCGDVRDSVDFVGIDTRDWSTVNLPSDFRSTSAVELDTSDCFGEPAEFKD